MVRSGNRWVIFKKDLRNGSCRKENFSYKGKHFIEYYIYKNKKEKLGLFSTLGKPLFRKGKIELSAIIVCGASQEHIVRKLPDAIIVQGFKFTETDINKYLRKTNRTTL